MNSSRYRSLNNRPVNQGPIIYWMSRDQRVFQNWALLRAAELAIENNQLVVVVFNLLPSFLRASPKQIRFMLEGLQTVQKKLIQKNIPLYLLQGDPLIEIPRLLESIQAGALVCDFSPLKIGRAWREHIAKTVTISVEEVDAHNIVPAWIASQKQEFGAYTLRPKIHRLLPTYLDEFPGLTTQDRSWSFTVPTIDWNEITPKADTYEWISSGEDKAIKALERFRDTKISRYDTYRNDPTEDAQSNLSPYLHFGQLSAQYMALEINKKPKDPNITAFLEESIVRRELSDNFCLYNSDYDSFTGFPNWAQQSLNAHRSDHREFIYTQAQFEQAETHDELWNAAQIQMVSSGKMHGYMRMYWAKKILEWTESPEDALGIAIYLNDTYELDGRDPNGYTGIAWSIGGVHDRAWFERPVFGKIRYMNYNGAKTKFNVKKYIDTWKNV